MLLDQGWGVTKSPSVNPSVKDIFDFAILSVKYIASHPLLKGVTTAELQQHHIHYSASFNDLNSGNESIHPIWSWWRHQMEKKFHVTGTLCREFTSHGEFPSQRPVTWSFDVFFDLHLNKQLSKQSRHQWFEMPLRSLWRHCSDINIL